MQPFYVLSKAKQPGTCIIKGPIDIIITRFIFCREGFQTSTFQVSIMAYFLKTNAEWGLRVCMLQCAVYVW